jgi:hypothetical protein
MERRRGNPLLPLVFDGRGAATTTGAGSSGGLRGGCAGGRRSSAVVREWGMRGGRLGPGEEVGLSFYAVVTCYCIERSYSVTNLSFAHMSI